MTSLCTAEYDQIARQMLGWREGSRERSHGGVHRGGCSRGGVGLSTADAGLSVPEVGAPVVLDAASGKMAACGMVLRGSG